MDELGNSVDSVRVLTNEYINGTFLIITERTHPMGCLYKFIN